ncbi:MAG: recombinase family protein [Patescibacteria group bacterium]
MNIQNNFINNINQKQAVIYIRVSSEEQVTNFSLQTQEEICRREAKFKGYEIAEIFKEEGKSAKNITGRPTLIKMLEYCRKNKQAISSIFVYRLDRLSRQTEDYLAIRKKLLEYNITIVSATEPTGNSPTEKLLETVLASFAQHDNDVRSERTKNGMRARFLSGLVTNHVPFGYINQSGYAIKDPKTFDTYKRAWDLMATGTKSLREMVNIMKGWELQVGGIQTVQHMFRNKFYMGLLTSKVYPEEIKGQHIPMVTEEQFYKIQAILDGRDTNKLVLPRKSRDNMEFPLRRIIRCGKCGAPFTGAKSKGRNGYYSYYFCRNRCVTTSIPTKTVDEELKKRLTKLNPTKEGLDFYCNWLLKTYNKKYRELQKNKSISDDRINKLYALRQVLIEKNLAGTYSDEIFKEQNSAIEEKIIVAQTAKNDALIDKYNINSITEFINDKMSDLAKTYANSGLSELRCFLGSIFPSGFSWDYPGCSNRDISPIYKDILNVQRVGVLDSSPARIRT